MSQKQRERWGSQLGVVLAVAGSAVGLGNFLRFPGQLVNNGGGAFMIPYMISLLLVAIPISMSEWALGRYSGNYGYHSQMGMFYLAGGRRRSWGVVGGLMALIPFAINMYYIVIEAWCLLYALQYLGGIFDPAGLGFSFFKGVDPGLYYEESSGYTEFFAQVVGMDANGSLFTLTKSPLLLATIFCAFGNLALICRGIAGGIEKVCKAAAPLILICSAFIILRVVTLGNPTGISGRSFLDGLGFMWNPTRDAVDVYGNVTGKISLLESLRNPEVWLAATAQIFFTLSLCWCSITTYASYLRRNDDIALSSVSATTANEFCEVVLGGVMIAPPTIMFLGTAGAQHGFESSFALGFTILPEVFGRTPFGQFFGFAFYMLLFTAAITTSVSLLQPTVSLFQDAFKWKRELSASLAAAINLLGALFICWYTHDLSALNFFDFWVSCVAIFIFALIQTYLVAYVWGADKFRAEIRRGSRMRPPTFIPKLVKYVTFPYLAVIVIFWMVKNLKGQTFEIVGSSVKRTALIAIACLAAGLLVLSWLVTQRWKDEGKKDVRLDELEEND